MARIKKGTVLILDVGTESGGSGTSRPTAAAGIAGSRAPRRRARPGTPNPALQGSKRPGLGSEVDFGVCVIHLEHWRGMVVLGVAHAWTAAALSGQARRRAHVLAPRMRLGYGK